MKHFLLSSLLVLLCGVSILQPAPVAACVGKSLHIGSNGTVQQNLLAEILSMLISERTGTTVKVERLSSSTATHEALRNAELDISVEYTGASQLLVLKGPQINDPQQLFDVVKTRYNEELNLVWLQPFGFSEPRAVSSSIPAQAAPVVRKDTLKKFPALARLLNKLGGTIDTATMQRLETAAETKTVHEVAKEFLKSNRLI